MAQRHSYQGINLKAGASLNGFALRALAQNHLKQDKDVIFLMNRNQLMTVWDDYFPDMHDLQLVLAPEDEPWLLEIHFTIESSLRPSERNQVHRMRLITPYLAEFLALAGLRALNDDSQAILPEDMLAWLQSDEPFNLSSWAEQIAIRLRTNTS
jgi:hypothetical protein